MDPNSARPEKCGLLTPLGFPVLPEHWTCQLLESPSSDQIHTLSGYKLSAKDPLPTAKSALIIFHGFGEHSGRYMHFPNYLEKTISEVWMMDHVGHGKSTGKRGHIDQLSTILRDMEHFVEAVLERTKAETVFILGHSFGGLLTLRFIQEKSPSLQKIKGVMVSSPFLGLTVKVNIFKEVLAQVLVKVWGDLSLSSDFDATVLSKDVNLQAAYKKDRLNHSRMSPQMYEEIKNAQNAVTQSESFSCDLPLAFFIPEKDPLVDSSVTKKFVEEKCNSLKDKSFFEFPNQCHEMMNEVEKETFFKAIENWMILKR